MLHIKRTLDANRQVRFNVSEKSIQNQRYNHLKKIQNAHISIWELILLRETLHIQNKLL